MEFALTDEQTAMVDTARQFAGDRLAPGYAAREKPVRWSRKSGAKWVNWA